MRLADPAREEALIRRLLEKANNLNAYLQTDIISNDGGHFGCGNVDIWRDGAVCSQPIHPLPTDSDTQLSLTSADTILAKLQAAFHATVK